MDTNHNEQSGSFFADGHPSRFTPFATKAGDSEMDLDQALRCLRLGRAEQLLADPLLEVRCDVLLGDLSDQTPLPLLAALVRRAGPGALEVRDARKRTSLVYAAHLGRSRLVRGLLLLGAPDHLGRVSLWCSAVRRVLQSYRRFHRLRPRLDGALAGILPLPLQRLVLGYATCCDWTRLEPYCDGCCPLPLPDFGQASTVSLTPYSDLLPYIYVHCTLS